VQVIVEVEVEAGTYASEQYQSRINAPEVCPNCGIAQSLEAHGYYWRWVTEVPCGRVLRMAVRRFLSVLRSDGQLSAALRAALSSRVQRNHRSVFRRQNRSE
jgi:hypothetical protein